LAKNDYLILTIRIKEEMWSAEELEILQKYYPHMSTREVAKKLDRTLRGVEMKATRLGLKKSQ
jgi:hypothetical protein